ncbi:hypothetical protein EC957_006462 [Mortierella hygrophila]|uniref:Uncharacterized protein n=1 Tax=Mortierella hygrophila TaxID=979708 RepID=A0A9P6EZD1_9FUNG|nr:hypothetical protein EC957_006462 [Mortierella hygrophila]
MENNLAVQAKQALTNLYHWVLDHQPHHQTDKQPTTVSSVAYKASALASSFVESYLNPSHTQQQHPAEHSLYLHYQPPHQHHSTAAASSSSSSSTCGPVGRHNAEGSSSFCYRNNLDGSSQNPIIAFFQSITHPDRIWQSWDPVTSFDSFLWNYTPDIHALQERVLGLDGLGGLSEKYNIDPRILALALALPLVMVLLAACAVMGAGNSSEDGPSKPRYPGQKTDPTLVDGGKGEQKQKQQQGGGGGGSKQQQQQQVASGSSVSGGSSKRGEKKQGGGPSDAGTSQYLLGANSGVSSWSALLGSMGFRGGETLDYKPLDILASFKDGTKTNTENPEKDAVGSVFESMSALGSEMMKRIPYQHILDQDIAQLLGSDFLDSDHPADEEGSSSVGLDKSPNIPVHSGDHTKTKAEPEIATETPSKGAAGSGNLKEPVVSDRSVYSVESTKALKSGKKQLATHKQKPEWQEQKQNKQEKHIQNQERNSGRQSGQGPAGPGADDSLKPPQHAANISPLLRTHSPRPSGSFKESDRPKVHHLTRVSTAAAARLSTHQTTGNIGRDFGSKIFGFVQDSQLLRNMDSISGGLLGSTVATVAALAFTAEATAGIIKNNMPDSVTDFTDEVRESFDHAMRAQDSSAAEGSNKKAWGARDAISKVMEDYEGDNIASTQTNATSPSASSDTPVHKASTPSPPPPTSSKTTASTTTGTIRVALPSGSPKTPASKPTAGFKSHPAEDIAHHNGPVTSRVVEIDEGFVLTSEAEEKEANSRSSSGRAPKSKNDKSLSEELASAMETGQKVSYADVAAAGTGAAPSGHTEHEHEDYYLEDEEDSGEEADNDEEEAGGGVEEEDDDEDTDTFVVAKDATGHIPSRARLQEHQPPPAKGSSLTGLKLGHSYDDLVRSISSISTSSSTTGGSIADDELPPTLSTTSSSVQGQEMTVDSHGNKVPVSEARRDSGYDLLL